MDLGFFDWLSILGWQVVLVVFLYGLYKMFMST